MKFFFLIFRFDFWTLKEINIISFIWHKSSIFFIESYQISFYFRTSDENTSTTLEAQTTPLSYELYDVTTNGGQKNLGELGNEEVSDIAWPFIITGYEYLIFKVFVDQTTKKNIENFL